MIYLPLTDKIKSVRISIVMGITIVALLVDTIIAQLYRVIYGNIFSSDNFKAVIDVNVFFFILIIIISTLAQLRLLTHVRSKALKNLTVGGYLRAIDKIMIALQYVQISLVSIIIFQMVLTSSYSVLVLILLVIANYSVGGMIMTAMTYRFYSWFRTNRTTVVLLYCLATGSICVNAIFTVVHATDLLLNQPSNIRPHLLHVSAAPSSDPLIETGFLYSSVASFALTWVASAVLLRHYYSVRLGKVAYWIVMAVPLAYFLSQYQTLLFELIYEYLVTDPVTFGVVYTLVFALSKPIGGLLFGLAFWTIAKSLPKSSVKDYMIMSAYGLVLFFISNQAIISVNYGYPPFGIIAVSFVGMSSYLIFIGIYSSAVSVAQDVQLRRSIKKMALDEASFLHIIGSAQEEQQIIDKVLTISKMNQEKLEEGTGLETSLEDEDITEYIKNVLKEIKNSGQPTRLD